MLHARKKLHSVLLIIHCSSNDQYEIIGLHKISHFINVCLEKALNASKLLKQCSTLAKQSRKLIILIYSRLLKFQISSHELPAVRPGASLQIFHRLCTVAYDLRIFRSAEDLSTAPSIFLLTITGLPSFSLFR